MNSIFTLDVAGLPVTATLTDNRLEIPMRTLLTRTLGMAYTPQGVKLAQWTDRLQIRRRKVCGVVQPCLPAHRLTPFLWSLSPRRPETRAKLKRLQDGWDTALLAWHGVRTDEVDGPGAWLSRVIAEVSSTARHDLARLEARAVAAEQRAEALAGQLAAASRPVIHVVDSPVQARWGAQASSEGDFLDMARLHDEGLTATEIAERFGCSRTKVSLFLDGKYASGAARTAWASLKEKGWSRRAVT